LGAGSGADPGCSTEGEICGVAISLFGGFEGESVVLSAPDSGTGLFPVTLAVSMMERMEWDPMPTGI
jgi:hypothetical protein